MSLVVAAAVAASACPAARAEPKYSGWSKVEGSREMRELKEKLRDGGQLDGPGRLFIEETVLPQLALEENRPLIERTRKRLRELLLSEVPDERAYGDLSLLLAEFMTTLARDEQADPAVRVNAMLLVGEIKSRDGRPWPPAALSLSASASDKALPAGVRIAALAGVARHAEKVGGDEAVMRTFGTPVFAILEEPAAAGVPEQEWLVSRAVGLVPLVARPAPPKFAAALAEIVADQTLSIDLRVRAAAALGATADAQSGLDAAAVVEAIRRLAVTALETDVQAAEVRRFEVNYRRSGAAPAGPPGFGPDGRPLRAVDPAALPEQICRRAAWRLHTLGAAILSIDGKQGLATLLGDAGGPARDLAQKLKAEGLTIDSDPVEDAVLDALDVLRPPAPGAKPAKRPARQPKPDEPAGDEKKPDQDPNASPFDNPFQ
ncbi:MAG: hypothetical protein EBZ74_11870 [Planctomycetia bacterium]|nr:hypothetical protein [Planctomycetia bacterium]